MTTTTAPTLHEPLLAWYETHRRDLPWRRTREPYAIWVSEIMLQQTQVATVIPYWNRWMTCFPTAESLATADEQEVLAVWQGLGYYRRCRLLQQGARFVAEHGTPKTAEHWRKVPGVGAYTAGAIASIACGDPAALVDGNVERVYARLTGDGSAGPELSRHAWSWARKNLDADRPGDWNQALMELGATVCTPKNPACDECPISCFCEAFATGNQSSLPTKVAKPKPVSLSHVVWIPLFEGQVGIRQIPSGSWWEGMWEFPRFETTPRPRSKKPQAQLPEDGEISELRDLVGPGWLQHVGEVKHTVTNHRISIEVHLVRCESRSASLTWHSRENLTGLPMPSPQRKVLKLASALIPT